VQGLSCAQARVSRIADLRYTDAAYQCCEECPMPNDNPPPPPAKLKWIGVGLLAVAAFMFISIIIKTALKGP
jgi:hypothetical protein